MSEQFRTSSDFSEEAPLFENNNRRGRSRGEAIFGDKHAQFETPHTDYANEGKKQLAEMEAINRESTVSAIGSLAARRSVEVTEWVRQQEANGNDIDQGQIDKMKAYFAKKR